MAKKLEGAVSELEETDSKDEEKEKPSAGE